MREDLLPARPRKVLQVSTRTLILVVAMIAVWFTVWINRSQIALLEARVQTVSTLARELVVDDPGQFAVVKKQEYWSDEDGWKVYLPPGNYRLCLATRDVADNGPTPVMKSKPIAAGRHEIIFDKKRHEQTWRVAVTVDGSAAWVIEEPNEWDPSFGSSGTGVNSASTQYPADSPVVLLRRRFTQKDGTGYVTPTGPCNGVQLWFEPAPSAPPAATKSPSSREIP